MEIVIDTHDPGTVVAQLIGQIERAVLRDEVEPGGALPSIRQLANDLELDDETVARAYRLLERDSVIRRRVARGPVIHQRGKSTLRLMAEMSVAREIHDALISPIEFSDARIEVLGVSSPSTDLGGDLIDLVDGDGATAVFLADAAGHGVGAGIVMAMAKSSLRTGLRNGAGLAELLGDLNAVLADTAVARVFATLACVRVDRAGRVEYALAGHHHIAHYRASCSSVHRLNHGNLPLGLFQDRSYTTALVAPEPGDLLALWTDGLHETVDADDEELGHEAIERTIARLAGRPLPEIRQAVFELAESHGEQQDDRSLVLVRFLGSTAITDQAT